MQPLYVPLHPLYIIYIIYYISLML